MSTNNNANLANLEAMPVMCIKQSPLGAYHRGIKGGKYFIKRSSIYMDPDGTAYGQLYEDNELTELKANVRLDRFMSI